MLKFRKKEIKMFQVYTSTDKTQDSKKFVAEFKEWDDAMDCAEAAIEGKTGIRYIVEETNGTVNSYGDLIASVVAESDFS
jgi:hypothetical protein